MLKMNSTYTWEEITREYPDLWVIITNVKESAGEIKSCKLLDVCTKGDKYKYIEKYLNSNIKFECHRTTFKAPNAGILD
ncbi:MAG: hypothetical protein NC318_07520 [Blautia sp.]|nr:hypothetical protein [Lachnoclostridium sp.]MCM1211437.1 hypothetical protein [Blautia sp.]